MKLYNILIFILVLVLFQSCSDDKEVNIKEINTTNKEANITQPKDNESISEELKEQNISTYIYEIDNKRYSIDSLPKKYRDTNVGKNRFYFLKNYIDYQLVLESLPKEQKQYAKKIEKNRKKILTMIAKKGNNIGELDRALIDKKIIIDTIAIELIGKKDENLSKKIEAFYKKNLKYYNYPNTVEISAITIKQKEEMEAVVDKLKKDKITLKRFSNFATLYSSSPKLKKDGGYIGKISAKSADNKLFQTLWDSNTTEGFFDKIIKLNDFYTVIYIHQKKKAFVQTLDKEREEIKKYLLTPKIRKWIKNRIKKIMKTKKVKIYDTFKDKNITK